MEWFLMFIFIMCGILLHIEETNKQIRIIAGAVCISEILTFIGAIAYYYVTYVGK